MSTYGSPDRLGPRLLRRAQGAQSTLEYAMCVAAVSAAVVTMSVYVRRAIQANFKALENQMNAEVELR